MMIIDLFTGAIAPLVAVLVIFGTVKKTGAAKTLLIVLFTLYLAEMLDLVGVNYAQFWKWNPTVNLIPFSDLIKEHFSFGAIFQFAANIILFIPFGIFLPLIWKSFRNLPSTLLAGGLLSLCIELAQLFSSRVCAVDDLLMNSIGTLLGYLIISGLRKTRWRPNGAEAKADMRRDCAELLTITALVLFSVIFIKYAIGNCIYSLEIFR